MTMTLNPSLWYTEAPEEAARFYAGIIPDSRIDRITQLPDDLPHSPPGGVVLVEFTLAGTPVTAIRGGKLDDFNHAISLVLACDTQDEIDHLWQALLEGGVVEECGWLRDRYGLAWQIVPRRLAAMMADPDRAAARRAVEAMLGMVKLDLGALEDAFAGRQATPA